MVKYTIDIFKKLFDEIRLNFNTGTIAWILHRITGLLLVLYICMHTFVIGSAQLGTESFNKTLAVVQTPVFHVIEIGLIGCIFFHMLNGLRLVVIDFTYLTKTHKVLFWILMIVFSAFWPDLWNQFWGFGSSSGDRPPSYILNWLFGLIL